MNIKSKISKLVSGLLCFSMIFSNVLPAHAADAVITENTLDGEDLSVNERNLEDITVTYKQASSFFVTIPKTIILDGWKQSTYAVKVSGDIDAEQCVYVAPVDGIADTENIDFYMKDQASENAKDDVVANVTHNKFHWNSTEVAAGHKQADNLVEAPDLTAGAWRGIFQMEIKLETHVTHKHNFVETITKQPTCTEKGEKTYTCDCGDSYTEEIPATGHNFVDGTCTDCGEKDPDHKHSYTETITKQPTCTEKGEKTFTCSCGDSYTEEIAAKGHHYGDDDKCTDCGELNPDHKHNYTGKVTKEPTCTEKGEKTYICGCGDSYTEEIPALGHNFVDGICTNCGEKEPDPYQTAPTEESQNWNYTLDDVNDVITLNYYIGKNSETAREVIVYANYIVNGKVYKTQLASNSNAYPTKRYMFNAYYQDGLQLITSIKFSKNINTSNVTSMNFMFRNCDSLSTLDISHFDTSNVTSMFQMFSDCTSLTDLNLDNFDTSNVTNMYGMFSYSNFTSLDLSSFDTSNVTTMRDMFRECKVLKTIYVSRNKWSTSKATTTDMFKYCGTSTVTYK